MYQILSVHDDSADAIRSWVLIGMALRFGYALGLHVRNEDRSTGAAMKEALARVWWGHYSLERFLAAITGRPSVGINRNCSVPLPLPLASSEIEEAIIESRYGDRTMMSTTVTARIPTGSNTTSPRSEVRSEVGPSTPDPANSGSYLKNIVQLGEITQEALDLYRASTVGESWQAVQQVIQRLQDDLDLWANDLPEGLYFLQRGSKIRHTLEREQNALEMLYHSTRILITRPCICRLDRRIRNQTAKSSQFNQKAAAACVKSATSIAALLPGDPEINTKALYECGPWWSMVHTIMQSLVVLLLEISFGESHGQHESQNIMPSVNKLVRWLRAM